MKSLSIVVKSAITNSKGEVEEMSIFTEAQYQYKGECHYLIYDESELTGLEGTKTMLKYGEDLLEIRRYGTVSSSLKVGIDTEYENYYKTPYGVFTMLTKGYEIQWLIDPLRILMDYDLEIVGNGETTRVVIEIEENHAKNNE